MAKGTSTLVGHPETGLNCGRNFPVASYDLDATLASGQAFRWRLHKGEWTGVIAGRWVALRAGDDSIIARTVLPQTDWNWLADYLQVELDMAGVLTTFPDDEPMRNAVAACRGLRLLRQDPWECLASFILSSTKQIVQIQQIVSLLCERYGEAVSVAPGFPPVNAFPSVQKIAGLTEADLRACKMGFRAPYLLATARLIESGQLDLANVAKMPVVEARAELMQAPGVGRKIADCVLLFAYGFQSAFPVDVWVMRALKDLYFPRRRPKLKRLHHFSQTYFGPNAGYAQQYLFHYMRVKKKYAAVA